MILLLLLPNFKLLDLTLIILNYVKAVKERREKKGMKVKTFLQVRAYLVSLGYELTPNCCR